MELNCMQSYYSKIEKENFRTDFSDYEFCQKMLESQVEVILKKQATYREIDSILLNLSNIYAPQKMLSKFPDLCTAFQRDKAVSSLKFLCTFYDLPSEVFFLSSTLFDSLIENNQIPATLFGVINTSCFYVSAISHGHLIQIEEIVKFTSCTGSSDLIYSTINFILAKLQMNLEAFPSMDSVLKLFIGVLLAQCDISSDVLSDATRKLETLVCSHKFTSFKAEELVLSLCHFVLKEFNIFDDESVKERMFELHHYCQINQQQYSLCLQEIEFCVQQHSNQKSINPRLQLSWTISKKLLLQMKPSTKIISKLESIAEDPYELPVTRCESNDNQWDSRGSSMPEQAVEKNEDDDNDDDSVVSVGNYNGDAILQSNVKMNVSKYMKNLFSVEDLITSLYDNDNLILPNARFQPLQVLFLPTMNLSMNQIFNSHLSNNDGWTKNEKHLIKIRCGKPLFGLVLFGSHSKCLVFCVASLGQCLELVESSFYFVARYIYQK